MTFAEVGIEINQIQSYFLTTQSIEGWKLLILEYIESILIKDLDYDTIENPFDVDSVLAKELSFCRFLELKFLNVSVDEPSEHDKQQIELNLLHIAMLAIIRYRTHRQFFGNFRAITHDKFMILMDMPLDFAQDTENNVELLAIFLKELNYMDMQTILDLKLNL